MNWQHPDKIPGSGSSTCTSVPVTFNEIVATVVGQTIKIVGSIPALGSWAPASAITLSASQYTTSNNLWDITLNLAPGTSFEYKFINVASDGTVTWESDPNRSYTVPTSCTAVTVADTWRWEVSGRWWGLVGKMRWVELSWVLIFQGLVNFVWKTSWNARFRRLCI